MKPTVVLTVPEVARVVSRLEPRSRITEHQVRYLATQRCVVPTYEPTTTGDSALYTPVDVALIRLVVRLVAVGAPFWMARAAVAQCAGSLSATFQRGREAVFVVRGPVGALETHDVAQDGPVWSVRLADVRRGLMAAIRAERERQPLWKWGERTSVEAIQLMEATA